MRSQPHSVAARLGLDGTTIHRLQARGHLPRLALTEPEIRKRLYHAHLAEVQRDAREAHAITLSVEQALLLASRAQPSADSTYKEER